MKILIADDETPIREWIQFSIERGNHPDFEIVGVAENGNDALELALEHHVDTVITDIKMPGMDGLMLMKKLLEKMPYVSFIILTNYAEFSYAREAITYGAKKYFLKSELRGQDILEALLEIESERAALLEAKEEDCYSNGYLDIFTCCHRLDDGAFIRSFWQKHHFMEELDFAVVALRSRSSEGQKEKLDGFIRDQKLHILRPVLRNESIYLILQAESGELLKEAVQAFVSYWNEREPGIIVSSRNLHGIDRVMEGIEEAERMLQYDFFYKKGFFPAKIAENGERLERRRKRNQISKADPTVESKGGSRILGRRLLQHGLRNDCRTQRRQPGRPVRDGTGSRRNVPVPGSRRGKHPCDDVARGHRTQRAVGNLRRIRQTPARGQRAR